MKQEFIVVDGSVQYTVPNPYNPIGRLVYTNDEKKWSRDFSKAHRYPDTPTAKETAQKLTEESGCKTVVFLVQTEDDGRTVTGELKGQ